MACTVFISYRYDDAPWAASRISDSLKFAFGDEQVYFDVDTNIFGESYINTIFRAINEAIVCIVVIGPYWLSTSNDNGRQRLNDSTDLLRREIEFALEHKVALIPVLVDGARLPDPASLPTTLRPMVHYPDVEISRTRYKYDIEYLVSKIQTLIKKIISLEARLNAEDLLKKQETETAISLETIASKLALANRDRVEAEDKEAISKLNADKALDNAQVVAHQNDQNTQIVDLLSTNQNNASLEHINKINNVNIVENAYLEAQIKEQEAKIAIKDAQDKRKKEIELALIAKANANLVRQKTKELQTKLQIEQRNHNEAEALALQHELNKKKAAERARANEMAQWALRAISTSLSWKNIVTNIEIDILIGSNILNIILRPFQSLNHSRPNLIIFLRYIIVSLFLFFDFILFSLSDAKPPVSTPFRYRELAFEAYPLVGATLSSAGRHRRKQKKKNLPRVNVGIQLIYLLLLFIVFGCIFIEVRLALI